MKKIFFSTLFLFAISNITFAQEKKAADAKTLAKAELNELVAEITLDNSLEDGLYMLLVYKHDKLANATSDKERNEVYETMKSKLDGSLSPEQLKKLKSNKKLYENLIK